MIDLVVARQAIFDRAGEIYAYELLFRSVGTDSRQVDGDLMTGTVLFSSMNIGIQRLVGSKFIFCNADRGLLVGDLPITLPPRKTVIEVLETVLPDEEVLLGCRRLIRAGYRLALDDFQWFDGAEPMLELASLVKIDLRLTAPDELPELIARCRAFGVELVAEKIETEIELQTCRDLGFDYFQGYALSRPRLVPGKTLDASRLAQLRIATAMMSGELEVRDIEEIIRSEPGLALQLLNLAAVGAGDGLRRPIRSIRDALVLIGSQRIQGWLSLLLLRPTGPGSSDELADALARASMCEALVRISYPTKAALGFTAGILSSFERLLGVPADELLATLPLDDELKDASFGCTSPVGRIVRDVIDYQAGKISDPRLSGLPDHEFDRAAVNALAWALEATANL